MLVLADDLAVIAAVADIVVDDQYFTHFLHL
jgi:hypothetical protein